MGRSAITESVVTRLVATLVIGGLLVSLGLSALEMRRSESELQFQVTQRVAVSVRNLQSVLRGMLVAGSPMDVENVLHFCINGSPIAGVRLAMPQSGSLVVGRWPASLEHVAVWTLPEEGMSIGQEVDLEKTTLIEAPFVHRSVGNVRLELIVDGPAVKAQQRQAVMKNLAVLWLFLAVMVLIGLMLARQWFTGPLSEVVQLTRVGVGPGPFYRLSSHFRGEFAQLCESIGSMLGRLEIATNELQVRECALADLYQKAPAAMASINPQGIIIEANERAAELLNVHAPGDLLGKDIWDMVLAEDRALLRQSIDRLNHDSQVRCEVRLQTHHRRLEASVELSAIENADGSLSRLRLAIQDISAANALRRDLADKGRLLNMVLDHMSEAVLLVDSHERIAAANQHLATLLDYSTTSLVGQKYDAATFWDSLDLIEPIRTIERLEQIQADRNRPAQQRVETRNGVFQFEGIPVHETQGNPVGRLWVVRDVTLQEQNQRLLDQQSSQLQALRRLGMQLANIKHVDDMMVRATEVIYDIFAVESVGISLRRNERAKRSQQVLHRGDGAYLLESNRALIESVERYLMPLVLASNQLMFWSDLPMHAPWAKGVEQAGLTCLAAVPLRGTGQTQGVLWIARRGGERLEQHHMYWLETLAPVIAARLDSAQLREGLSNLELTDVVTDLPNRRHFEMMVRKLVNRPGHAWSAIILNIDHFRQLNDVLGHERADTVLLQVADALRKSNRRNTFVARLGGDMFGLLLPETGLKHALGVADRVRSAVASVSVYLPDGVQWKLTSSVGMASNPEDGPLGQAIVELAFARAEMARNAGRDCVISQGAPARANAG